MEGRSPVEIGDPVSHARIFWLRHATCAVVLLAWIALVPVLHLGITLLLITYVPALTTWLPRLAMGGQ